MRALPAWVQVLGWVLVLGALLWMGGLLAPTDQTEVARGDTPAPPAPTAIGSPTPSPATAPSPTRNATPPPAGVAGELEVHFVDVGQGDATLLRAPGATMLVDAGPHDGSDVVPYLEAVGVDTLDVVAITHPHADHLGQFDQVIRRFDVAEVWWSGATHTTQTFERALAALEAGDAAYEEPRAGDTTTVGSLEITVVNPPDGEDGGDLHDSGLAFRVTYGEVAFLFTGDAEAPTEQRMIGQAPDLLAADVYQVGHHGSRTSTSTTFLDAVNPAVAVYSARPGNQYGHPHDEVVNRLVAAGVELYGTAVHGTVVVATDGQGWAVTTERDAPPVTDAAAPGAEPETEPAPGQTHVDGCAPGQVDINTASLEELQRITQIGPDRARQIIDLRPFAGVESLTRVPGIADGRLQQIKDQGLACA